MFPQRICFYLITALFVATSLGCRSSTKSFSMNSDSGAPWFGLGFAMPKRDSSRKTLETISDRSGDDVQITSADLREPAEDESPRRLLPNWLTGRKDASIPLPVEDRELDDEQIIELEGPREEFP